MRPFIWREGDSIFYVNMKLVVPQVKQRLPSACFCSRRNMFIHSFLRLWLGVGELGAVALPNYGPNDPLPPFRQLSGNEVCFNVLPESGCANWNSYVKLCASSVNH